MAKSDLEKIIDSIGAIAEMSVLYYNSCIKSGASSTEALLLTRVYLDVMLEKGREDD